MPEIRILESITEMISVLSILAAIVELSEYSEKNREYTIIANAHEASMLRGAVT